MKEETDVRQPPQGKRFVTVHTEESFPEPIIARRRTCRCRRAADFEVVRRRFSARSRRQGVDSGALLHHSLSEVLQVSVGGGSAGKSYEIKHNIDASTSAGTCSCRQYRARSVDEFRRGRREVLAARSRDEDRQVSTATE